jgi:serine/threonine protein kinase
MGNCLYGGAPARLIDDINGNEEDYHNRFMEDEILGEGEFGQVRMVHDMKNNNSKDKDKDKSSSNNVPYACKLLRKGVVFKDNTLYSPIKPAVLRGEVEMLRSLQGKEYCLKLIAIYETPRVLYMITEYCGGGEMMEYVSHLATDLTLIQVSRIAFQLLSALHHCATHKVIHRDVKPENAMFQDPTPSAELRLIDFGSGTFIHPTPETVNHAVHGVEDLQDDLRVHTTFAGSAFYISPEMFQHAYTYKTDVWSAGATLYVLVAGYPADELQKAFNILQTSGKHRKLRELPNLPLDDLPNSFFQLLEGLLTYRHKSRPSAGEMRLCEFCQLHKKEPPQQATTTSTMTEKEEAQEENVYNEEEEEEEEPPGLSLEQVSAAAAAAGGRGGGSSTLTKAGRLSLAGTAGRHQLFLGFKKYERSLTALLAAVLSKAEFAQLLVILKKRQVLEQNNNTTNRSSNAGTSESNGNQQDTAIIVSSDKDDEMNSSNQQQQALTASAAAASLSVIPVRELKLILQEDICNEQVYVQFSHSLSVPHMFVFFVVRIVFVLSEAVSMFLFKKLHGMCVS